MENIIEGILSDTQLLYKKLSNIIMKVLENERFDSTDKIVSRPDRKQLKVFSLFKSQIYY